MNYIPLGKKKQGVIHINIGQKIKKARQKAGKSQQYIADILEIDQSNVSRIENNTQKITVQELKKICEELNISADDLLDIKKG